MSLALRTFTADDQARFAALSGDHNPMHVDAVAARRTIAGEPVVHGVHLLLWALDAFAAGDNGAPPLSGLRADFTRFVTIGEPVDLIVHQRSDTRLHLRVIASGTTRCDIVATIGDVRPAEAIDGAERVFAPETAIDWPAAAAEDVRGNVPFAAPPAAIARAFPAAARWIGASRLAALAAATRLVGMVLPGLHSVFAGLRVDFCAEDDHAALAFAWGPVRHRLIEARIAGGGVTGTVRAMFRAPPQAQPGMAALGALVPRDAFAGSHMLVIGGSRGLGELTAKLVAAGGGRVTITYRIGEADAARVAAEIAAAGGRCAILPYAVGLPAGAQLAALAEPASHAAYFATPLIARPQTALFDAARLTALQAVYVDGLWDFAQAVRAARADIAILYPSSVFVTDRPRNMLEYAMAKAAGELLCAEIVATQAPTRILAPRLPRLATDQTAGALAVDTPDAAEVLLPLLLELYGSAE